MVRANTTMRRPISGSENSLSDRRSYERSFSASPPSSASRLPERNGNNGGGNRSGNDADEIRPRLLRKRKRETKMSKVKILALIFAAMAVGVLAAAHAHFREDGDPVGERPQSVRVATVASVLSVPKNTPGSNNVNEGTSEKEDDTTNQTSNNSWNPPPGWKLSPLRQIDVDKYTVRINAWKRPEQLVVSVNHLRSCPNVAQVQIIWCDKSEEPPGEVLNLEDVVIERHDLNSLNERFRVLSPTDTLGILSIDDDVIRPCEAMDSGFFRWTRSPDRMVGFDGRLHVENQDGTWQYGYLSTMKEANKYSISLTRFCFMHRDYMDLYINHLPPSMLERIAKTFNCEDIAMSFLISSLTGGQAPLLADYWAVASMIKLHTAGKISATKEHKSLRDNCVNDFAKLFGLKDKHGGNRLRPAKFFHTGHDSWLECGDRLNSHDSSSHLKRSEHRKGYEKMIASWRHLGSEVRRQKISRLFAVAGGEAFEKGFIKDTKPWRKRLEKDK